MVNIALEEAPVSECPAGDPNHDGKITIDEIIRAENNALNGCMLQMSFSAPGGFTPLNERAITCPVAWSAAPRKDLVRNTEAGLEAAAVKTQRKLTEKWEAKRRTDRLQVGKTLRKGRESGLRPASFLWPAPR